jgi:hypothetical protein
MGFLLLSSQVYVWLGEEKSAGLSPKQGRAMLENDEPCSRHGRACVGITDWPARPLVDNLDDIDHLLEKAILLHD